MDKIPQTNRMEVQGERGITMLAVVVALTGLIASMALALDVGMIYVARNQAQNVADASALAAARHMIDDTGPSVTLTSATDAAREVASANRAVANASMNLADADITYGGWDLETRSFDGSVDLTDPDQVTAVQVATRLDGVTNEAVPAFMARVLGRQDFTVSAEATAYLGYAGRIEPGELDFPVAIDCCKLRGSGCSQDYCTTISTPPNACALSNPQDAGPTTVSCLEFSPTGDQNACWTQFDGESSSTNSSDLRNIVENGSSVEVSVDQPIFVDNGTKNSVIDESARKFEGTHSYSSEGPAGDDYYPPFDGNPDSWVVRLPVVECQSEAHCATGAPMKIVGAVCFEVREIQAGSSQVIRGSFMCPTHPRWDECDLGVTGTGGLDFGIRADLPVLVR